jgi:uncharacterized protein (TIGR03066 family)
MKTYILPITVLICFTCIIYLAGCKDKDEKNEKIDKTALLIGTWTLTETTDPVNAPVELQYSFEEDGTLVYRVTVRKGKTKSINTGTWRFTDAEQTTLELNVATVITHTIEVLDETTLRLNDGIAVLTFTRQ